ncbi:MAG TPA: heparinase II/III family protein [Chthoniobacteraceae bacterium]|nr:heparinase II/III family protein [Chthoniobacteraceae bacterium]
MPRPPEFRRLASGWKLFILPVATFFLSASVVAFAAQAPVGMKREVVLKSLTEHDAAWKKRLEGPRPHLYFNAKDLKQFREQIRSDKKARFALLETVGAIVAKPMRSYTSPEEEMKARGVTRLAAAGELWQRHIADDLAVLCIAGLVEDSPAIREKIRELVLGLCHYPTWGFLGSKPNIDSVCAIVAERIAVAWDWFPELWTGEDRKVILETLRARVNDLQAGGYGAAYWYNVYDHTKIPVRCAALGVCGAAFYNEIPEAPEWLAFARLNFQKVARLLPADGSSSQGVSYWSYGIFYTLQYIEATRGIIDSGELYDAAFLRNAVSYRLHSSTSGFRSILPWGDTASLDYSGPRQNLYRLAEHYHDDTAWWLAEQIPSGVSAFNLFWGTRRPTGKLSGPQALDHYFPDGGIVTTRTGWGGGDYLLSLKAGFANRAHSHLDIGALALAFGNEWLLTAPGYGKDASQPAYWKRNGERWKFFAPSTESHCTLLVNGENQRFDIESKGTIDAFFSAPLWTWSEVDLTGAYHKVSALRRGILHRRGEYIVVLDSAQAPEEISLEWLAQPGREPIHAGNALEINGENGNLRIEMLQPARPFSPRKPTVPKIDVLAQEIHTHAVREKGRSIRMIALMTPGFGGAPLPKLKAEARVLENGREVIEINGPGWTDRIERGKPGTTIEISIPGLHATAQMVAIRTTESGARSLIATGTRELDFAGVRLAGETPCDIGFEQTPEGRWIVDCSRRLDDGIKLPEGETLAAMDSRSGNAMADEGNHRYVLIQNPADALKAQQWLATLIHSRSEPELKIKRLPEQPALSPENTISIEAEDFTYQSKGKAKVKKRPGSQGGYAVTDISGRGHSLGWRFTVATAGQYHLKIRYATPKPDLRAAIMIDQAIPGEAMREVLLPAGDGFGASAKNWKETMVSDRNGTPLVFNLSAGEHEVRLSRMTEAVELDSLLFTGAE